MIQLEIDGKAIEVQEGTMLIEATKQAGQYVPHFCYHKKLSIAANCRMCLVEVEKAPKPLPACATPVTQGMKVFTNSEKAKAAQKSVLEFLLINHPLDCPICDQGGECQLQDLTVGYGKVKSRYQEEKRIVFKKEMGPLVCASEMTRCIHCTRCVRFGQEVAGIMELGMLGRGEHSEITNFIGNSVSSELSGNMIDLCPVGALTSKPFRYTARTWELSRRFSISSHDALGSNLMVQVKNGKVMRVLPQENENINECWLSDKDRFSYEGLYHNNRLENPMLKDDNDMWHEVEWGYALQTIANKIADVKQNENAKIGGLFNSNQTCEEIYLFKQLLTGLGSKIIDFRLKHSDLNHDETQTAIGLNGVKIKDIEELSQITIIGSFLKNDYALLCSRIRRASKNSTKINSIHASSAKDWLVNLQHDIVIAPHIWISFLTQVKNIILKNEQIVSNLSEKLLKHAQNLANSLLNSDKNQVIALGSNIIYHPKRSVLHDICLAIANHISCKLVVLPDSSNMLGAYQIGAYTGQSYQNLEAYFLMGLDIDYDVNHAKILKNSLKQAKTVIAFSAYRTPSLEAFADIILPISTSFETSGSFINMEGKQQSFNGVAKPVGLARPTWKVLKVIGDTLGLNNFDYESREQITSEIKFNTIYSDKILNLENSISIKDNHTPIHFERISDNPIYHTDAIVRHSAPLQKTIQAKKAQYIYAHPNVMQQKNIQNGENITLLQGQNVITATIYADDLLCEQVIRIPSVSTAALHLDALYGDIAIEKIENISKG